MRRILDLCPKPPTPEACGLGFRVYGLGLGFRGEGYRLGDLFDSSSGQDCALGPWTAWSACKASGTLP